MSIAIGLKGEAHTIVTEHNTAQAMGSGSLPVFATPAMAALMEQAAYTSLLPCLDPGQGSVGISLSLSHVSATPVGMNVRAESLVTEIDGKKITFSVSAYDDTGLIGEGTHQRFLIDNDRFLAKANGKKAVQ